MAGLVCACLALGGVGPILRACERVLEPLGPHPARFLSRAADAVLRAGLEGFKHRFFDGTDLAALLAAIREARAAYGGLEALFLAGDDKREPDYAAAASAFVRALSRLAPGAALAGPADRAPAADGASPWRLNLLPDPARGSASKRLFLYLRWMIRRDAIDPGGWDACDPGRLLVPLDTHMGAACRALGLLSRKGNDLRAAREASAAFRALRPDDPVRYDFALTRPGIHPELVAGACFESRDLTLARASSRAT